MSSKADVLRVCQAAVRARLRGDSTIVIGNALFDLTEPGMCAKFVRQAHEAAMHISAFQWEYCAATARLMEGRLKGAGKQASRPSPGDIVALNNQSYSAGHIAIYAGIVNGVESIYENTSATRGNPSPPGTKLTPLSLVSSKVSGYYGVLPAEAGYYPGAVIIEVAGVGQVDGWFTDHATVGVKALGELLGYTVTDRVKEDRKVVLTKDG